MLTNPTITPYDPCYQPHDHRHASWHNDQSLLVLTAHDRVHANEHVSVLIPPSFGIRFPRTGIAASSSSSSAFFSVSVAADWGQSVSDVYVCMRVCVYACMCLCVYVCMRVIERT